MEVLVLGSNPTDMQAVTHLLSRAGHGVHRCAPDGFAGRADADCVGSVSPATCPLVNPVDVAVMVDSGPRIAGMQPIGLGCAVRDHVPVAVVQPGEDPVLAAIAAMRTRDNEWSASLREVLDRSDVSCTSTRHDNNLRVEVQADVDAADTAAATRLSTRAYDVVRGTLPSGIHSISVGMSSSSKPF